MPSASTIQMLTQLSYLIAAALFILGLKRMSSPVTAVSGVRWAGMGMVLATVVTLAMAVFVSLFVLLGALVAAEKLIINPIDMMNPFIGRSRVNRKRPRSATKPSRPTKIIAPTSATKKFSPEMTRNQVTIPPTIRNSP